MLAAGWRQPTKAAVLQLSFLQTVPLPTLTCSTLQILVPKSSHAEKGSLRVNSCFALRITQNTFAAILMKTNQEIAPCTS